jgi:hypothetical protein
MECEHHDGRCVRDADTFGVSFDEPSNNNPNPNTGNTNANTGNTYTYSGYANS